MNPTLTVGAVCKIYSPAPPSHTMIVGAKRCLQVLMPRRSNVVWCDAKESPGVPLVRSFPLSVSADTENNTSGVQACVMRGPSDSRHRAQSTKDTKEYHTVSL